MFTRPFLVEEIMLEAVSGAVEGIVSVDDVSGVISDIDLQTTAFRRDDTDHPVVLSPLQRERVLEVVQRTLEAEGDLGDGFGRLVLSADAYSPRLDSGSRRRDSEGANRVLAEQLSLTGESRRARRQRRRAE